MANDTAIEAALGKIELPRHTLVALVNDYMRLLEGLSAEEGARFEERFAAEAGFADRCLREAGRAVTGATLAVTLDESVDFAEVAKGPTLGADADPDLAKMRAELVWRAARMNKDLRSMTGLKASVIDARIKLLGG